MERFKGKKYGSILHMIQSYYRGTYKRAEKLAAVRKIHDYAKYFRKRVSIYERVENPSPETVRGHMLDRYASGKLYAAAVGILYPLA